MSKKDDRPEINISAKSEGQTGGITAGVVINIQGTVPARAEFSESKTKRTEDGYVFSAVMVIVTEYSIPKLRVIAVAPTLKGMEVDLDGGGVFAKTGGTMKTQDGRIVDYFNDLQQAGGRYRIEATTAKQEPVQIRLERV